MPESKPKQRRLTLSPTSIRSWLECKLQYKFAYIDRLSRFYYRPNRFDSFGASLHRALQLFHEAGGPKLVDEPALIDALNQSWISAGYEHPEQEAEHLEKAVDIVRHYHADSKLAAGRTLFIEKQIRRKYDNFTLMGRLDRLDEHPDTTLEIIDYKSWRQEITSQAVHDELAMAVYALLVSRENPGRRVLATIISLSNMTSATTQYSPDELDVLEEDIRIAASQIIGREEFLPTYGPHCEGCIFNRLCYKGGPVDWEQKAKEFEEFY